jgi:uncharacterized protein (DUF169 family)
MVSISDINGWGRQIEQLLLLRTSPIAVKFLESESDIPEGALRPKKDRGQHLAQCQAFAMSRREGATVAMLREDHWCWAPLIAFGLVPPLDEHPGTSYMVEDREAARKLHETWPDLGYGKYVGILSAPLKTASFAPDLALVYCNSARMRTLIMAVKYKDGARITSEFDPIDSCVFSTVPTMLYRQYRMTLPDPGEFQRALAAEDEIILSVPAEKLGSLVDGLTHLESSGSGYRGFVQDMRPDFPRPGFYKKLFKNWGLDVE